MKSRCCSPDWSFSLLKLHPLPRNSANVVATNGFLSGCSFPPPPDSSFFLIAICSDSAGSCSTESGENNIERQSIYITSVQCLYPLLRVQENPVIVGDDFEWHEDFFLYYLYVRFRSYSRFIWTCGSIYNKSLLRKQLVFNYVIELCVLYTWCFNGSPTSLFALIWWLLVYSKIWFSWASLMDPFF